MRGIRLLHASLSPNTIFFLGFLFFFYSLKKTIYNETERLEKGPICLVCPTISDRFSIILNAAALKILYISLPKPACDALANTKPCRQNCLGGRFRTLVAPEIGMQECDLSLKSLI